MSQLGFHTENCAHWTFNKYYIVLVSNLLVCLHPNKKKTLWIHDLAVNNNATKTTGLDTIHVR